MSKVKAKYNLALALGGGGARGLAHIGVLKVIERNNIPIDLIVGTSMGAIIGGMYAQTGSIEAVEKRALQVIDEIIEDKKWFQAIAGQSEVSKKSMLAELSNYVQKRYLGFKALTRIALEPKESLYDPLTKLLDNKNIQDTKIPFTAVSLDLISGDTIIQKAGPIIEAVYASSAIEGIFPPLEFRGRLLGDGGPANITPVEIARNLSSRLVVGVDVHHKIRRVEKFANGLEVIMRADNLGLDRLRQIDLAKANLVIAPNVGSIHWANFKKARECIRRGEQAAEIMLPMLKRVLKPESLLSQFKRGLGLMFKDLSEPDPR